ncbi:MAG: hypothetical protein MZV65_00400 [Chromatiales bacterium]|nr:hypothetical protein [Chromatiales bacterium]
MHDPNQAELENNFKEIAIAFKGILSWNGTVGLMPFWRNFCRQKNSDSRNPGSISRQYTGWFNYRYRHLIADAKITP